MFRPHTLSAARWALAPLAVWGIYLLRANIWFRLYPVLMTAVAFSAFALSLRRVPLVEVIARRSGERLDESGISYCRAVTVLWMCFLSVHLAVTVVTVFASYEVWVFYNGFAAYVLMGALFAGEWLYRRRFRRG